MEIEKELLKLIKKAYKHNEIPVAALIVKENKIIAKAHNNRKKYNDVLGHAEILAIKKATKKLKDWRLTNCEMYVTIKPCKMCENIIKESRIEKVYYCLTNPKIVNRKIEYIKYDSKYIEEYKKILKKTFENIRI